MEMVNNDFLTRVCIRHVCLPKKHGETWKISLSQWLMGIFCEEAWAWKVIPSKNNYQVISPMESINSGHMNSVFLSKFPCSHPPAHKWEGNCWNPASPKSTISSQIVPFNNQLVKCDHVTSGISTWVGRTTSLPLEPDPIDTWLDFCHINYII